MKDDVQKDGQPAISASKGAAEPQAKNNGESEPVLDGTKLHIKIFSPYKVYYDDNAKSISAENDTGPFDILPRHHNFITLLRTCEIVINTLEDKEKRIRISKAVMHVRHNSITVFLDV